MVVFVLAAVSVGTLGMSQSAGPSDVSVAAELHQHYAADSLLSSKTGSESVGAFYAQVAYTPVWTRPEGITPEAQTGLQLLTQASRYGLKSDDYDVVRLRGLFDSLKLTGTTSAHQRATAEMQLTATLLRFVRHLHRGRIEDSLLRTAASGRSPQLNEVAHLHQALRSGQFAEQLLTAQPTSRSYVRLLSAWQRLLQTDSVASTLR